MSTFRGKVWTSYNRVLATPSAAAISVFLTSGIDAFIGYILSPGCSENLDRLSDTLPNLRIKK
jgi:hypothetical protein